MPVEDHPLFNELDRAQKNAKESADAFVKGLETKGRMEHAQKEFEKISGLVNEYDIANMTVDPVHYGHVEVTQFGDNGLFKCLNCGRAEPVKRHFAETGKTEQPKSIHRRMEFSGLVWARCDFCRKEYSHITPGAN